MFKFPMRLDDPSSNPQRQKPAEPQAQDQVEGRTPSFMQRAHSSGIDVSCFSFAKPVNSPKSFLVRAPLSTAPINPVLAPDAGALNPECEHDKDEGQGLWKGPRAAIFTNPPPTRQSLGSDVTEPAPLRNQQHEAPKDPETAMHIANHTNLMRARMEHAQKSTPEHQRAQVDSALIGGGAAGEGLAGDNIQTPGTASCDSPELATCSSQGTESAAPKPLRSPVPQRPNDKFRVSKGSSRNRKAVHTRRYSSITGNQDDNQITEEKLFELLIGRIRQREETEAANVTLQQQMEAEHIRIAEENQHLRHQLETYHGRLQKSFAEVKDFKDRIENWKSKIRKFKQVVNELGHEHETLRDDNKKTKETAAALEKERHDLMNAIDEIKAQISRAREKNDQQRSQISNHEKCIAVLEQKLSECEQREKASRTQLAQEKKRASILELHIQNNTRNHSRQLGVIREDQRKLLDKLDCGLGGINQRSSDFEEVVRSKIEMVSADCRSSIESLVEMVSAEAVNTQSFTEAAHGIVADVTMLSAQFTEDVRSNTRVSSDLLNTFRKDLEKMEGQLDSKSLLVNQLRSCKTSYECLKASFEVVQPALDQLNSSVKSLAGTEDNLSQGLKDLSMKLAEPQVPATNPVLEMELSSKFAENTQLQLRIHDKSSEMETLRKQLSSSDAEIHDLQQSLVEIKSKHEMAEEKNQHLEAEKKSLGDEFECFKRTSWQEADKRKASAMDQLRLRHEDELQTLQKEKDTTERAAAEMKDQLSGTQECLAEAKRTVEDQRHKWELMVQENEYQVEQLSKTCSEYLIRLDAQVNEIQRYEEQEATSRVETADLRRQLEESQHKVQCLEQQIAAKTEVEKSCKFPPHNITPFATIQSKLSPRQGTSPYNDPADFAMLFMSDEFCPMTPFDNVIKTKASQDSPKSIGGEEVLAKENAGAVFDSPAQVGPPKVKRKEVNFRYPQPAKKTQNPGSTDPDSFRIEKDTENPPNKISKQVHKWTYSRVHSSATEIQQEQSSIPVVEQRASPKGLKSASSGNDLGGRTNAKGRGRRRSRGERYNARFSQDG